MTNPKGWRPALFKPPLLSNYRGQLGNPAVALAIPLGWRLLLNLGLPLVVGAGAIALAGSAVKSAVPEVPINRDNIGLASLTGGGGIAAYYLSDMLPQEYRPIAYAMAVAGIATSVYFLFQPKGDPKTPGETPTGGLVLPPTVPSGQEAPLVSPGWLAQMLTLQLDPRQDRTGGVTRSMLLDQDYAFSVRNQSQQKLAFFAGLDVRDDEGAVLFRSPALPTLIGRKLFSVPPGGVISETLTAESINFWLPQTVTVVVQLFRKRDDESPFMESAAIPIKMTYPVYAGLR